MTPPGDGPADGAGAGPADDAGQPPARRPARPAGQSPARRSGRESTSRESTHREPASGRSGSRESTARRSTTRQPRPGEATTRQPRTGESTNRQSRSAESRTGESPGRQPAARREPLGAAERAARRRSTRQAKARARTEAGPETPRGPRPLTRRRVLARRWAAVTVFLALVAAGLAVYFTPVLGVATVEVSGAVGLSADAVRSAAAVPPGTPMVRLDTGAVAARVATLPRVATVQVSRDWPDTVRIAVTERTPVGVVPGPGGVHLVDGAGVDYATVPASAAPPGLPRVDLPAIAPDDPRTQAVVQVLAALPAQLRGRVAVVSAQTAGSVQLGLADGRTVRWGSSADSARKSAVLAALMTQPGKVFDVSSPDLPTIS